MNNIQTTTDTLIPHFYKSIQGWFDFDNLYSDMVKKYDKGHFVEVGTWKGKSAAYMGVEIINSKKDIIFDCIDTWVGSPGVTHQTDPDILQYKQVMGIFINNVSDLLTVINPIKKDSLIASRMYDNESLDFIFIDANHAYDAAKKDIETWFPKIKKNGIFAGHDYRCPEVKKAVEEIFGSNYTVNRNSWIIDPTSFKN